MADIYRTKVTQLARALQEPESRPEATEALRGLVDAIVLTPDQGEEALRIELRGNLAAMLGAARETKRSSEVVAKGVRERVPQNVLGCSVPPERDSSEQPVGKGLWHDSNWARSCARSRTFGFSGAL
jgi:hypothetical protein